VILDDRSVKDLMYDAERGRHELELDDAICGERFRAVAADGCAVIANCNLPEDHDGRCGWRPVKMRLRDLNRRRRAMANSTDSPDEAGESRTREP